MTSFSRRRVLRGMMEGAATAVGLPFLDCFLNANGTALASGRPLPVRFGTWNWGCGVNQVLWQPDKLGADYDLKPELKPMEAFKNKVTVLSGFNVLLDGGANLPHIVGNMGLLTGSVPKDKDTITAPTVDTLIAAVAGTDTRFRSIEVTATGNPSHSYSRPAGTTINPGEVSPAALYARIFGSEFQDPNAADFKPNPNFMARKSVLSSIKDQRDDFVATLGAADKARLDQYFTSVRQLEQQLELQLQKPPPAEACSIPKQPRQTAYGVEIDQVIQNHALMAQLLAMAVACNQTKVVNVVFSDSASSLCKPGSSVTHHQTTHEERINDQGFQPQNSWFITRAMEGWATFLTAMDSYREGEGTVLDNSLILGHTDVNLAQIHQVEGIPAMFAGSAGGKVRTGLHIAGTGEPITRIGLTAQQVMGVSVGSWGTGPMKTSKPISEIMV
jgi:hypothetical protein